MIDLEQSFRLREYSSKMSVDELVSFLPGYHILSTCVNNTAGMGKLSRIEQENLRDRVNERLVGLIDILIKKGHSLVPMNSLFENDLSCDLSLQAILRYSLPEERVIVKPSVRKVAVLLVGYLCSGKDTIASLMSNRYKARMVNYSDLIGLLLPILEISDPKRSNYKQTGDLLRTLFGKNILSIVFQNLFKREKRCIIYVGPRFVEEITAFEECKVIGVRVDPADPNDNVAERFKRYKERSRVVDIPLFDEFSEQELEERKGIEEIFALNLVNYWIINNYKQNFQLDYLQLQIQNLSWIFE